jgi:type I restriction enzyme, R subunit
MLENVRKRLRSLVKLVEKRKRTTVYSDFQNSLGEDEERSLPGFTAGTDFERFRTKAMQFLRANADLPAIQKLRFNEKLSPSDVKELERMLLEAGAGTAEDIVRAKREGLTLGLFLRSLVGLDHEAAKRTLDTFLDGKNSHGKLD